jgi:hypothetical protein
MGHISHGSWLLRFVSLPTYVPESLDVKGNQMNIDDDLDMAWDARTEKAKVRSGESLYGMACIRTSRAL